MQRRGIYSRSTLVLSILGILLNMLLVWLTKIFQIPLYLDSIGTVIVAALGGALPGITVGFFSNCITSFTSVTPDSMTMYYAFISVLLAAVTSLISKKGLFRKWYGRFLTLLIFCLIGGALGSVVTWMLYGFSFGEGITAPLAIMIYQDFGFSKFAAQFTADMLIDFADKLVTLGVLCLVLYLLPASVEKKLPLGMIYQDKEQVELSLKDEYSYLHRKPTFRKRSINTKITFLLLFSATLLSVVAISIGTFTYRNKLIKYDTRTDEYAVDMMLEKIDGDRVDYFLQTGKGTDEYETVYQELSVIFKHVPDVKYMYVYKIQQDGCHVVFDLDTEEMPGEPVGSVVAFDETFPYVEELLAGKEIPSVITNDTYGWLLTVYKPIVNNDGNVVAYACADFDMKDIRTNTYTFLINTASLLFAVMILIAMVSIWYCDRNLLEPISVLAEQAHGFDYDGDHRGERVRDKYSITTGDELEEVFCAMCKTEDAIAEHVEEMNAKNHEISKMQRNIIYTLASMVESRDGNTGGHIRRTANYVRLIGRQLKKAGIYADVVDYAYIKKLYNSAPLHDIGKIKVSDTILNKPGRLTPAEYELMKEHTTEGREILQTSLSQIEDDSWLTMAIDMATYHHERWDGHGYPEGLKEENIPLCARIMAVADVFDALVSERSYKSAYSYEDAIKIIKEESGSHFDPIIVSVFVAAEQDIKTIMKKQ